jgi:hypothetical protein
LSQPLTRTEAVCVDSWRSLHGWRFSRRAVAYAMCAKSHFASRSFDSIRRTTNRCLRSLLDKGVLVGNDTHGFTEARWA